MHIEDFYEAEMLFQNVRVVMRFAYMIVEQIRSKISSEHPLVIVGYEPYSTILLEYITAFIENSQDSINVSYGIYGHNDDGKLAFYPSAHLNLHRQEFLPYHTPVDYATIYPIGTTLSTVYHMQNAVTDYFRGQPMNNLINVCVLLISEQDENGITQSTLSGKFWEKQKPGNNMSRPNRNEEKTVALSVNQGQDSVSANGKVFVRYLLEAKTQWHEQSECADPRNHQDNVLVYVDPTSTIPSSIFPLEKRRPDSPLSLLPRENEVEEKEAAKNNDHRLELLRGCVHYGHIRVGNNHFQYHIDLPRFLQNALEQSNEGDSEYENNDFLTTLKEWANDIDAEAYNIIVTPLEQENATFLRLIVDRVFAHSIRIIRVPLSSARKEDIRAKYSYISEEYRNIKETNSKIKIHVYFVTMSIVTGESFHRAQKLVGMLLNDSGYYEHNGFLFNGVFTLLNRSSRSTINTMVDNPANSFHAYLQLAIPHYNTSQGKCPACRQYEKNLYLQMHCATNKALYCLKDTVEFSKLRTTEEYVRWRAQRIWTSRSEFEILALWLEMYVQPKFEKRYPGLPQKDEALAQRLRDNCREYLKEELAEQEELKKQEKRQVPERFYDRQAAQILTRNGVSPETVESLWINGAVQDVAFRRLQCTHNAYCRLEDKEKILSQQYDKLEEAAINVLTEIFRFPDNLKHLEAIDYRVMEHMEELISYIKVISREYLSKHHYIRSAMFQIMSVMLRLMLEDPMNELVDEYPSAHADRIYTEIMKPIEKTLPHQRYRLMMTLMNQLSTMQANIILHDGEYRLLKRLLRQVSKLRWKAEDMRDPIGIPYDETVEDAYIRCIKKGLFMEE